MRLKFLLTVLTGFFSLISLRAQQTSIAVYDFVKIKDGRKAETVFYYEQNWKKYREVALQRGLIKGFAILEANDQETNGLFDLILITEYADSAQHAKVEENFRPIMDEINPDGPKLLNEIKPADFRTIVFGRTMRPIISSE